MKGSSYGNAVGANPISSAWWNVKTPEWQSKPRNRNQADGSECKEKKSHVPTP